MSILKVNLSAFVNDIYYMVQCCKVNNHITFNCIFFMMYCLLIFSTSWRKL